MSTWYFFDLDLTLYNTNAMVQAPIALLKTFGIPSERISAAMDSLSATGFTVEALSVSLDLNVQQRAEFITAFHDHLTTGEQFLIPGTNQLLTECAKRGQVVLLTFGVPSFQMRKCAGINSIHHAFTACHFVWKDTTKGAVIKGYAQPEDTIFFCDDSPHQLTNVTEMVPQAQCIRVSLPECNLVAHPDDHTRWKVVHSIEQLHALLC